MLTEWKKAAAFAVLALCFFGIMVLPSSAYSPSDREGTGYGGEIELPREVGKLLEDPESGDAAAAMNEVDTAYFLRLITDALKLCFGGVQKNTALMLGATVMSALVNAYCRGDGLSSALGRTAGFVSVMCTGLTYYSVSKMAWDSVKAAIDVMTIVMSALLPGVVASCAASGEVALSTVSSTGITLLLTLFERLCSDVLLPILNVCFALALANGLADGEGVDLSGVGAFVKSAFMILMGVLMAVFCMSVIYRTNLARTADGLLLRSVRFASGSFIPIVGGALSEASASVIGSLSAIRKNAGTAASVAIAVATVPHMTELLLYRLSFYFCGGGAKLLGSRRDSAFISELGSMISSGIVIVLCCGVMLLISLATISGG